MARLPLTVYLLRGDLARLEARARVVGLARSDLHFEGSFPLTIYADAARAIGSITEDAVRLEAAAAARAQEDSELPPP